jgi:SAM-dependent methyltransferase
VLDVLDEDAIEIEPDEGFDVLLTHDFRVAAPSNPPTGAPTAKPSQPPPRRSALADIIPPDADPVWAREAVLALIAERAATRARPTGMWYHELFNVDYLKSELPVSPEQIRSEVDFIETALALPAAGRVLDLGCGYGRHTVPLARRGYDMVGLDLSIDLLQNALRRAQAKAASIKFVHGDIRDLEFDQVFDGVYCFNTTLGYFSDTENLTVLRGVHRALKPGGRFLIEVVNRDNAIQSMPIRNWWEGDGCLIQEDVDFDHLTSRLMVKRFLVYADGTQREYDIALRLFSVHELVAMLRLVGFRYVDLAGSLHTPGAFFGVGSDRILLTVER